MLSGNVLFQLWSSKWSIKDEHKLLSELGGSAGGGNAGGATAAGASPQAAAAGYYDHGFSAASSAADLYDTISTMSQTSSQNLYTSAPIAGTLGKY